MYVTKHFVKLLLTCHFCFLPDFVGCWNLARIALNDNFACLICFAVASHIYAVHMVQQNKVTHCCPLPASRAHNHLCVYPKLGIYHTDVPFLGVFATLWKVTVSFLMCICLHGMTHLPLNIINIISNLSNDRSKASSKTIPPHGSEIPHRTAATENRHLREHYTPSQHNTHITDPPTSPATISIIAIINPQMMRSHHRYKTA